MASSEAGNYRIEVVTAEALPTPVPPETPTPTATPSSIPRPVIRVTKTTDTNDGICDADCSLREAIRAAGPGDKIIVPRGTYTLTFGSLSIEKDLTLAGAGAEDTIIQAAETPDEAKGRVFSVGAPDVETSAPGDVTISGVTIRHGSPGIYNFGGTLTLTDSIISGNRAKDRGGAILNSGGTLTLINSIVNGNQAATGGGIASVADREHGSGTVTLMGTRVNDNVARIGGGIFVSSFTLTLIDSTVSGNVANGVNVSSGVGGGISMAEGMLTLTNSTVSGNTARDQGGGIYKYRSGTLALTNSTVSGNTATFGDGGGIFSGSQLTLVNSTIAENDAGGQGGGVYSERGPAEVVNTIIAKNSAGSAPDCSGEFASVGHNLVGSSSACSFRAGTGDQVGFQFRIDPKLGPLQDNGGPTETHALLEGSPAIDAGADEHAPETDQRGISRPQGSASDIGAFES